MSARRSPSKSATPDIVQPVQAFPALWKLAIRAPSISHTPTSPDTERHRMSSLLSPSKSPTADVDHPAEAVGRRLLLLITIPFICHATRPRFPLRHRMSDLPSALKSPTSEESEGRPRSKSSALVWNLGDQYGSPSHPPANRTLSLANRVAVWESRGSTRLGIGFHTPAAGS